MKSERDPLQDVEIYDPFAHTEKTSSRHILYLSASSSSRSGYTASWIAKYWHGLQYVQELSSKKGNIPVTILDLAGVLQHEDLARVRLRVSYQEPDVQSFFDGIDVVDISSSIDDFLFNGGNLPDAESILSDDKEDKLIVISGWQLIEESLPPRLRPALNELERYLVQRINQSGFTTVWFLNPKPDEMTSRIYRGRCLKPFWDSSAHSQFVTDIVWNLPIRPYTSTQTAPMLDDLRVIIQETKDSVHAELIEIPYLKDWSSRFWSKRSKRKQKKTTAKTGKGRLPLTAQDILANPQFTKELIDDSVNLIPWLQELWPNKFSKTRSEIQYNLEVKRTKLYGKPSPHTGIMSRMLYYPPLKKARGGRSYAPTQNLIPKVKITHPRHYRRYRKKKRKLPNKQSYRAPSEVLLEYKCLRDQTARNVEIRRIKQTLSLLANQIETWAQSVSWKDLLKELEARIPEKDAVVQFDDLKDISNALTTNDVSAELWDSM
ncbi:MAG: hypothetical protein KAU48_05850, partial [Candidatus Thorarchaeota archaeon]|nr:hypothetical protein [Candidatus Thorarchaeota archaeon]